MGIWPFGGGKRHRSASAADPYGQDTKLRPPSPKTMARNEKRGRVVPPAAQKDSKRQIEPQGKRQTSPVNTHRTQPSIVATNPSGAVRTNSDSNEKRVYHQTLLSRPSTRQEDESVITAPPTLYAKRSDYDSHPSRRKSSKRKADDLAREREIRAMSSAAIPVPKVPPGWADSGPFRRERKQVPGDLNIRGQRPTSEVSLPIPDVLSEIDDRASTSFEVSRLAALTPRPTIKSSPSTRDGKRPSRAHNGIHTPIVEEETAERRRVHELADDLDSGGIREIMDRDRRRRERKREADKHMLQRKLDRRADRQREDEARRARTEAYVRNSAVDLAAQGSNHRDERPLSPETDAENPFADYPPVSGEPGPAVTMIRNPFEDEQDMDMMQDTRGSDDEAGEDTGAARVAPVPEKSAKKEIEPTQSAQQPTISPPISPTPPAADQSSVSQGSASLMKRSITPDVPERSALRRASSQSYQRLNTWTTFFKRGVRRRYVGPSDGRNTPSGFSNTSRESFQRRQGGPSQPAARTFRRVGSVTPSHAQSRFREDLPEMPISPPDSRVASPGADTSIGGDGQATDDAGEQNIKPVADNSAFETHDMASSPAAPTKSGDPEAPSRARVSQSMASIDSEGSWLSGRRRNRSSNSGAAGQGPRHSESSIERPMPGAFDSPEQQKIAGEREPTLISSRPDGHHSTIEQAREQSTGPQVSAGAAAAMMNPDETLRTGVARQATLVRPGGRHQSTIGLVNEYSPVEPAARPGTPDSSERGGEGEHDEHEELEYELPETQLLRARSIEYKGHARHISAGSAKLLDIKRSSTHSDLNRDFSGAVSPTTTNERKSNLREYNTNTADEKGDAPA